MNYSSYTSTAKWLHWVMAVLVIGMMLYGWWLDDQDILSLSTAVSYHAMGGFLIAALCILRYLWRVSHPPPELPTTFSRPQSIAAKFIHSSLYVLMILVPITGLVSAVAHDVPVVVLGGYDLQAIFSFLGHGNFCA